MRAQVVSMDCAFCFHRGRNGHFCPLSKLPTLSTAAASGGYGARLDSVVGVLNEINIVVFTLSSKFFADLFVLILKLFICVASLT